MTLYGIFISSSFLQSLKAEPPILVTLSGIIMLVSVVQSANAPYSMLATPFGTL